MEKAKQGKKDRAAQWNRKGPPKQAHREPVVLSGMTAVHTEGKSNPGSSLTGQTTEKT